MLAIAIALQIATATTPEQLSLRCVGQATRSPDSGPIVFPATVDVRVNGGALRVAIPKAMRPPLAGEGPGWMVGSERSTDNE